MEITRLDQWLTRATLRQPTVLAFVLLALAILVAYANAWHGAFLYDDTYLIVDNAYLRHWNTLPGLLTGTSFAGAGRGFGFYRPGVMLAYFLIYQAFDALPGAFHALNIALHIANACLVYRLGGRLGLRPPATFAAALLWALHPLHTEAVTYISGTTDLLCTVFVLLGVLALLGPRRQAVWLAMIYFALGLSAKETAIAFPALASLALFWRISIDAGRERWRAAPYARLWPLWLLALIYAGSYLILFRVPLYDPADAARAALYAHHLNMRIFTALATLPVYLQLIIRPAGLHMDRIFPVFTDGFAPQVLAGAALVLLVIFQCAWGRGRRGVALSAGLLWCAAALAPCTGIVKPTDELLCEHWLYLPSIGLALGLAATVVPWVERRSAGARQAVVLFIGVVALMLAMLTFLQNRVWTNTETLYAAIFRSHEPAGRAHNDLGIWYIEQHDFDRAASQFRAAIAAPAPLPDTMLPGLYLNLAKAYLGAAPDENGVLQPLAFAQAVRFSSHVHDAIDALEAARRLDPDAYWPNQFLAVIYAQQGDGAKAVYYNGEARAAQRSLSP